MVNPSRSSVVYKIVYPNGKIYVGQDRTDNINYFGSANPALIATDFDEAERGDFTIRRVVLWRSDTATRQEVTRVEIEWILKLRANDPAVGYNRWPRYERKREADTEHDLVEDQA